MDKEAVVIRRWVRADVTSGARIVVAGSLAEYLEGGGYWWNRLQYLLGLRALGHDVYWLDLLESTGDPMRDRRRVKSFVARLDEFGLANRAIVLMHDSPDHDAESFTLFNSSERRFQDIVRSADVLWNLCGAAKQPLLSLFRNRVLIDLDPGVYQLSALEWDMGLSDHELFLTIGGKVGDADCEVPTVGVDWRPISPFVFLPAWSAVPDPGPQAPFTSVTQWEWREIWLGDRVLSRSKREAYLHYIDLPLRTGLPFELAANIDPEDDTGDRELLASHGWQHIHPHEAVRTPAEYQRYIARSRAEFLCPKPVYVELKTGWLSDRSACYLATGRPVICQDTGFPDRIPTGLGLLAFRTVDEAAEAASDVNANYALHSAAARELAEDAFDSGKRLEEMLEMSFSSGRRRRVARAAGLNMVLGSYV